MFHELAGQRRSQILEGHMVQDHVHMLIRIPPKYPVATSKHQRGSQPLPWLGNLVRASGISMGNSFGQEVMRSRRARMLDGSGLINSKPHITGIVFM